MSRISTYMMYQRSLTAMLDQQEKVSDTQIQLSSGRRVLTPSDDPASAARVISLNGALGTVEQYQSNADRARSRLENEESVLNGTIDALQRAHELAVQGNNDTLTEDDTKAIAMEVRQLLDQVFSLANTRDGDGEYIFAGYQSKTRPFTRDGGTFSYQGDHGQRMLQISPDRRIADRDDGFGIFMDVPTEPTASGNTLAATSFDAIDAGDIVIDGGNGNGPVALAAIPAAADAGERAQQLAAAINEKVEQTGIRATLNNDGTTLTLTSVGSTGIDVTLSGSASVANTGLQDIAAVDAPRDIFSTLDQLATELEQNRPVDRYIADLQHALDNVVTTQTKVGARLNTIAQQGEINEDLKLSLEKHRSAEEDLDYAEAIARFERQRTALDAAQQSYVKIKGLSLFNYL